VKNDGQGLDYFIPPGEEVDPVPLVHDPARGYIAFAIGARHATKKLPAGKIAAVCRRAPATVILLGGKEDAAAGEEIARMAGDQVVNMCGKISLNQSASLVRQANAVITHDTGLMHIAAAFRKKIISVWGNTVPGFGMYPYLPGEEGNPAIVEVMGLKCRPCSKLGYDRCPKGHFRCMNDIREEEILGAL
jgi:ADP-heptose:LPS heptosyltransferase